MSGNAGDYAAAHNARLRFRSQKTLETVSTRIFLCTWRIVDAHRAG